MNYQKEILQVINDDDDNNIENNLCIYSLHLFCTSFKSPDRKGLIFN